MVALLVEMKEISKVGCWDITLAGYSDESLVVYSEYCLNDKWDMTTVARLADTKVGNWAHHWDVISE